MALKAGIASDPPGMTRTISYVSHDEGAQNMVKNFPSLRVDRLPKGKGAAYEKVEITTHNGTHLDAPWYFHPTMDGGKPSLTVDKIPLEWCFSDGVKLDFRSKPDGHVCTADEVQRELARIGYKLKPLDIVLEKLQTQLEQSGVNYLGCRFAFGDLSLAESLRSVELFARHVMPNLQAKRAAAE